MQIDVQDIERETFVTALRRLNTAGVAYVVAGAFCVHYYTGIWRYTKDMDLFALPEAVPRALEELSAAGYRTWVEAEHWLGKAVKEGCTVDIIFGSGNWLAPIDSIWLDRSQPDVLFGEPIRMAPLEEMVWAKSYIAGRERYDGADICHLIMANASRCDWQHLLWRYGEHWQLLQMYLNLYCFVYPSKQADIPEWLLEEFQNRQRRERRRTSEKKLCRGTLLDRFSYNFDVEQLGYVDARVRYAKAQGASARDVVSERAWAAEKLAKGEVYKKTDS